MKSEINFVSAASGAFLTRSAMLALTLGLASTGPDLFAVSAADANDSTWIPWKTPAGAVIVDVHSDQQTGQPSDDFVGDTTSYAFTQKAGFLTSGSPGGKHVFFRGRFGEFNPGGNGGNFSLGLDLTNDGRMDLIMRLSYKGTTPSSNVFISFAKPGTGANDGPSTTSWGNFTTPSYTASLTTETYNYRPVNDGVTIGPTGNQGYTANGWNTFGISYANLQSAIRAYAGYFTLSGGVYTESVNYFQNYVYDDATGVSFIAFTSTQGNAINQDLLGTNGNTNSTSTFATLGSGTSVNYPSGGPIPEPSAFLQLGGLIGAGVVGMMFRRRREGRLPSAQPAC